MPLPSPAPAPPPHSLGLGSALGIAVGTTVGAGVFAFTGVAAREAGSRLPMAYLLAVVPVLCSLAPVAMLAAALPTAGGNYKYPSRLWSPRLALLAIWVYAMGAFFGFFPLYALVMVDYLQYYFPTLPVAPSAAAILTVFYLLNYFGVRLAATLEEGLVVVLLIALLTYLGVGLGHLHIEYLRMPSPEGILGILTGASLLTFAYMGSNSLIELGHEIKNPSRTIPLAIGLCLLIVTVLYTGVGLVTVGAAPWTQGAGQDLAVVSQRFLSPGLQAFFVFGGALTAVATTLHASFLWGTKSLQVICRDGFLPAGWGADHPRWATPYRLLTGIYALSMLGLFLPFSRETLNVFSTLGGLGIFIPVLITSAILPRRCPNAYARAGFRLKSPWIYLAPAVGVALSLGAMITLLTSMVHYTALIFFGLWTMMGVVWVVGATRRVHLAPEPGWE